MRRAPRPPRAPGPTLVIRQPRPQPAHLGYGTDNCADEFLRQFADDQSRRRRQKQIFTVEQHAAFRESADLVVSIPPVWADNTKFNVAGILKKWKSYVNEFSPSPSFHSLVPVSWVSHRTGIDKGDDVSVPTGSIPKPQS
jgi:hypothetical protein